MKKIYILTFLVLSSIYSYSQCTVFTTGNNASCFGVCDGIAVAAASGGLPPYNFLWNSVPAQTTSTATGLCAGSYTVTVFDSMGSVCTGIWVITSPTQVVVGGSSTNASCDTCPNGTASASASGGNFGGYTYSWNTTPVQTTPTATGLLPGTYFVTVTDASGCVGDTSVTVTFTTGIDQCTVYTTGNNASCFGVCDGIAVAAASGGLPPYNFLWNSVPAQTTSTATGLCAGSYTVTVFDSMGSVCTGIWVITSPTQVVVGGSSTNASCDTCPNGTASASASGGNFGGYTYSWNTTPVQTTPTATGLLPGTYFVTVTDASGCVGDTSVTVTFTTGIDEVSSTDFVSIYPNPSNGLFTISTASKKNHISIFDVLGKNLMVIDSNISKTEINLQHLNNGVYFVKVKHEGVTSTRRLVINK